MLLIFLSLASFALFSCNTQKKELANIGDYGLYFLGKNKDDITSFLYKNGWVVDKTTDSGKNELSYTKIDETYSGLKEISIDIFIYNDKIDDICISGYGFNKVPAKIVENNFCNKYNLKQVNNSDEAPYFINDIEKKYVDKKGNIILLSLDVDDNNFVESCYCEYIINKRNEKNIRK